MTTIGREALATVDLLIAQGADFTAAFRYNVNASPVDLTDWSGRCQLRKKHGGDVWLTVSSGDVGSLTASSLELKDDGTVILAIPAAVTEDPVWNTRAKLVGSDPQPVGVWDLELTNEDGAVIRFAQGTVTISPDVTRTV